MALFLGVRPRFTVLDAIENLHRLDKDFLQASWWRKHKSGLDILAGSEQFDRPNAQDAGAIEELLRVLTRTYDYIVIDAGNTINSCAVAALYAADTIFLVDQPRRAVDPQRAAAGRSRAAARRRQRARARCCSIASPEQHLIAPKQIETALGYGIHHTFPSDYRTVSTALNSGVPLALANHSEIAAQFDSFTRQLLGAAGRREAEPEKRRPFLGIL